MKELDDLRDFYNFRFRIYGMPDFDLLETWQLKAIEGLTSFKFYHFRRCLKRLFGRDSPL